MSPHTPGRAGSDLRWCTCDYDREHDSNCPRGRLYAAALDLLTALQAVLDEPNDRNWTAARDVVRKATAP